MVIKSASFYPRPHVDSQAVLLELREDAAERKPACLYPLVRRLFGSRRKTIKNNLMNFCVARGKPAAMAAAALEQCALGGGRRAENLTLQDFLVLAKTMEDMGI
jgi:16S rRNA (adenine1518-N6/adenine1519-N6)-dimethyltransferase